MKREISGVTLECLRGDITAQSDIEAVVNAANAELRPGGGVAGAIHRAAGSDLDRECRPLAPIRPGEAVITGGHGLPNQWVIHCLGPVHGRDRPAEQLLADCYVNALRRAEETKIASVAFPAISTGAFGYPLHEAAGVAIRTVIAACDGLRSVRHVRFCLFDQAALEAHEEALRDAAEGLE
jgi:O-acetyl-ADP-ribose deacetylase (regulator of RNase III)